MKKALVTTLLAYFRVMAQLALKLNHPVVIGITGSVGKSSARSTIYGMMKDHFPTICIEKGNSQIGLPLGILGLEVKSLGFQTVFTSILDYLRMIVLAPIGIFYLRNAKYLIVEMGIDSPFPPDNMEYLLRIVKPDISVFLNVHPVHAQEFDKVVPYTVAVDLRLQQIQKKIAEEKGKIITQSGCAVAIYNADNMFVKNVVEKFKAQTSKTTFLSFGESSSNELSCGTFSVDDKGTSFVLKHGSEEFQLYLYRYILPKEYSEIFGSAVLLGKYLGLNIPEIVKSIETHFYLPPGRSTLLKGVNNSLIIDSSYNASKAAVVAFLELIGTLKSKLLSPTVFIFGDMRELGQESKAEHEEVAAKILQVIDYLYLVGPQTKDYVLPLVEGRLKEAKWFESSDEAGQYLKKTMPEKALVLVKGSQNTIFLEEAVKEVLDNKDDARLLCRQSSYWMEKKYIK